MSLVQSTGPAGYRYQSLATVYLGLIHLQGHGPTFQLISEPKGGEDMLVVFDPSGSPIKHHIQAKDRSGTFDLKFLAECMNHYGDNQGDESFLKRVLDKEIVWIFTSGKLADDLHPLETSSWSGRTTGLKFNKAFQTSLLFELNQAHQLSKTDLQRTRKKSWEITLSQLEGNLSNFNTSLASFNISLKHTAADLEEKIIYILNRHFQVIRDRCPSVLLEMANLASEKPNVDLVPIYWKVLQRNREVGPRVNSNYLPPPDENRLMKQVRDAHLLMLTGESWSGKTQLARKLAKNLYLEGYRFKETNSVQDASHFLTEPSSDNRVCILEDPFGHYLVADAWNIYLSLKELVDSVLEGRVLLVTCRKEVLTNLMVKKTSATTNIAWEEIGAPTLGFLDELITKYIKLESWTDVELAEFKGKLTDGDNVLVQVGQLAHLVSEVDENGLKVLDRDQLLRSARFDERSRSIYDNRPSTFATLMKVLSLNCNTLQSLPISSIPWFVCDDRNQFPVEDGQGLPILSKFPMLSSPLQYELDFLEKRGFVEIQDGEEIRFKHPNYLEVARQAIEATGTTSMKETLSIWDRSLNSPLPENARIAAHSIRLFYAHNDTSIELKDKLLGLGWEGVESRYPGIEEEAILFFAEYWTELSVEKANLFLEKMSAHSLDYEWVNGLPVKPKKETRFLPKAIVLSDWLKAGAQGDPEVVLEKFNSSENILTPEEFLVLVDQLKLDLEQPIAKEQLHRILSQPYFFIRRVASYLGVRHFKTYGKEIVVQVFREKDPRVLLEGIKGSFRVWPELEQDDQDWLFGLLAKAYQRKPVLAAVTRFMTEFSAGYGGRSFNWWALAINQEQKKRMWELWARLMVLFFKEHPASISFHTPRFAANMRDSREFLDLITTQELFLEWIGWAERLLNYSYWSEFAGNVCQFYLSLKSRTEDFRLLAMVAIIPGQPNWGIWKNLFYLIGSWRQLYPDEQQYLTNWCRRQIDKHPEFIPNFAYLSSLPAEIRIATQFPDLVVHKTRDELIENQELCTQLLIAQDVLAAPRLDQYAPHWQSIYLEIANRPDHLAWKWAMFTLTRGFVFLWGNSTKDEELVIRKDLLYDLQIVNQLSSEQLDWYIELLAYCMTYGSPEFLPLFFILRELAQKASRKVFKRIRFNITHYQQGTIRNVSKELAEIYFPKPSRLQRIERWVRAFLKKSDILVPKDLEDIHMMEENLEEEYGEFRPTISVDEG